MYIYMYICACINIRGINAILKNYTDSVIVTIYRENLYKIHTNIYIYYTQIYIYIYMNKVPVCVYVERKKAREG